jgi:pyruvate,orthophosphate dikinase
LDFRGTCALDLHSGDFLSLNGNTGDFYEGQMAVQDPHLDDNFHKVLKWATEIAKVEVHANADSGKDAQVAKSFGAQGVGTISASLVCL